MPNHVTNRVVVNGSEAEIARFRAQCIVTRTEKHLDEEKSHHLTLDFNTLIPMPAALANSESSTLVDYGLALLGKQVPGMFGGVTPTLDEMLAYAWVQARGIESTKELREHLLNEYPGCIQLAEVALAAYEETGYTNWYPWSIDKWGTKWNAYSFELLSDEPHSLTFTFDTAWSPPLPIYDKIAELFPELSFEVVGFDEGWNFAVEGSIQGGESRVESVDATEDLYERTYGAPYETDQEDEEDAA